MGVYRFTDHSHVAQWQSTEMVNPLGFLDALPGMLFLKFSGQLGVLLGTSRPSGPADLPSAWRSRKGVCRNSSGTRFRCSEATLPMIASVLETSASEHRFRCSEALFPMAGCRYTQHCFQKAVGNGTDKPGCLLPKARPNLMIFDKKL